MWGGDQTNIPRGWRLCDGGSLNNVTTPDLRGRFVLGYNNVALVSEGTPYDVNGGINARVGASLPVGTVNGEATHQLTVGEMPSHNHGVTDPGHNHTYVNNVNDQNTDNAFATETAADQLDLNQTTGSSTTGISINNTGGDQRHNNLPPFYVLAYIMKCF
jgi:microcystin-dependent protein